MSSARRATISSRQASKAELWQLALGRVWGYKSHMTIAEPMLYLLRATRRERLAESPLLAEAVRWFEHCQMLRDFENDHLLRASSKESLQVHRVVASDLIADGELLAWQARQENLDLSFVGFKVEDMEAETRLLRDNFAMYHEPMPAADAERILEAAFGQRRA